MQTCPHMTMLNLTKGRVIYNQWVIYLQYEVSNMTKILDKAEHKTVKYNQLKSSSEKMQNEKYGYAVHAMQGYGWRVHASPIWSTTKSKEYDEGLHGILSA